MKKKIWTALFALVICLCVTVPAFAEGAAGFAGDKDRVVDDADLLSAGEETALREKLGEICARQKMDIVIVTAKTLNGATPASYADDTYDYNGYGYGNNRDGLLLLISMEDRDWYISTTGYGITAFTDAGINKGESRKSLRYLQYAQGANETGLDTGGDHSRICIVFHYSRQDEGQAQNRAVPAGGEQLYEGRQHEYHREPGYVPVQHHHTHCKTER